MRRVILTTVVCLVTTVPAPAQTTSPAAEAFARLKSLEGDWIDVEGVFGEKGRVAVTYRVAGAGHTVVETFPVGTPYAMVTVYHLDADRLVLTHYCTSNTQPRMSTPGLKGDVLEFTFIGGTNIDPATTSHMHAARLEFMSADEIKGTWVNWADGRSNHAAAFRVVRKR